MPTTKQIDSNRDLGNFSYVLGGHYDDGMLLGPEAVGTWWGSTANNSAQRYRLRYDGDAMVTGTNRRYYGLYIRCVSEEKTVTDLTYLQDMTGEIADKASGFFISLSRIL